MNTEFFNSLWSVITVIGTLGGLLGYLVLKPKVSVSPSSFILNPRDPFATPFILANEGIFSIYKISVETTMKSVVDSRNNKFINCILVNKLNNSSKLESDNKTSLNMNLTPTIIGLGFPFKEAEIEILIKYHIFLFWKCQKISRFVMKRSISGESIWYPVSK